jgi:hypothetical protein
LLIHIPYQRVRPQFLGEQDMKPLEKMLADLRERNEVLPNSTGASGSTRPDETTIRTQLARRGYKLMRRRPPGNADTRFWLMFSEPLSLTQLNDFIIKLDGVQP